MKSVKSDPPKNNNGSLNKEANHILKNASPVFVFVGFAGVFALIGASLITGVSLFDLIDVVARTILRVFGIGRT